MLFLRLVSETHLASHWCLGGLQMIPARQTASWKSPLSWIVKLAIDLVSATFCGLWSSKQP